MERPDYISRRAWESLTAGADLASGFPGVVQATIEDRERRERMLLALVHCYKAAFVDSVGFISEHFEERRG